ncbi:hypothetical protein [Sphingobacterium wenxiniae]|uniref:hypothetical protein n=1 Tax=Sphingobacterium wenxiniae TaxID=683125 RepID=UPI001BAEC47E|nr:hypothetical protein [Sphingobacterium wenxiniae]
MAFPLNCSVLGGMFQNGTNRIFVQFWVNIQSLGNYDWAEADKPIVCKLMVE